MLMLPTHPKRSKSAEKTAEEGQVTLFCSCTHRNMKRRQRLLKIASLRLSVKPLQGSGRCSFLRASIKHTEGRKVIILRAWGGFDSHSCSPPSFQNWAAFPFPQVKWNKGRTAAYLPDPRGFCFLVGKASVPPPCGVEVIFKESASGKLTASIPHHQTAQC